jgi:hypothetical protein
VVLDPFAGSGAVLATAKAMDRNFIGTDLNVRYRKMFYDEVLPTVLRNHETKHQGHRERHAVQGRFASAVLALRCLKFSKELYKKCHVRLTSLRISSILAVPSRNRRELAIVFCFAAGRSVPKTFLKQARALSSRPPLSKYGLLSTIHVVTDRAGLMRALDRMHLSSRRRLFVYSEGRFYHWTYTATCAAFRKASADILTIPKKQRFPRLISPIDLRIPTDTPARFFETANGEDDER